MSDEAERLIEFHAGKPDDPPPFRAAKNVPDWLKDTPVHADVPGVPGGYIRTVKNCLPFLDAMNSGYIIPLRSTVHFFMRDREQLEYQCPDHARDGDTVAAQPNIGFAKAPFGNMVAIKFLNHWIVRTPPGYSALFLPLLNQFHMPFQILAGMVDTDTYYRDVFFPALCLMQPGQRCTLERGMPLVQVIPVKRETWRSEQGQWETAEYNRYAQITTQNPHHYRDESWKKKEYR